MPETKSFKFLARLNLSFVSDLGYIIAKANLEFPDVLLNNFAFSVQGSKHNLRLLSG